MFALRWFVDCIVYQRLVQKGRMDFAVKKSLGRGLIRIERCVTEEKSVQARNGAESHEFVVLSRLSPLYQQQSV